MANASTAAVTASSYWASVAWNVAPAGWSGSAGFAITSGSSDSTHFPARKIGCGLAPVVAVISEGSCGSGSFLRVVVPFYAARLHIPGEDQSMSPARSRARSTSLRDLLRVAPGTRVRLRHLDPS